MMEVHRSPVAEASLRCKRAFAAGRTGRPPPFATARTLLAAAVATVASLAGASAQTGPDACAPADKLSFVCGLPGPEDLVQVPGTNWVVVGGFANLRAPPTFDGGLALLDPARRTLTRVAVNPADAPRAPYDGCPTPPDPARFSAHGLNIRAEADGRSTLFVVGHEGREAIEVFEVAPATDPAERPRLAWIGCVPATAGAFNNAVAPLPDGSLLVTDFLRDGAKLADLFANRQTGAVYRWAPGRGWEKLPGTDGSGPNGIEVSDDRRYMFVADSGSGTVRRHDLQAPGAAPVAIDPGFRTDNIRRAPDGRLLLAGTRADPACRPAGPQCPRTLFVKALDPRTLAIVPLFETQAVPTFRNLSAALLVDGTLWLGSPEGDRIGFVGAAGLAK